MAYGTQATVSSMECEVTLPLNSWIGSLYFDALSYSVFFFFGCITKLAGSYIPNQRWNPGPQKWKHGALTTGPPRNFPIF